MIDSEAGAQAWVRGLAEADPAAMARLEQLVALLAEENTRQNLVARSSLEHVWRRHVADSAQLLSYVPRGTCRSWLDLGTGAGFPGLVIAALRPDLAMTLVESRARRIDWLLRACEVLGLHNVEVAGSRLESIPSRQFDAISARAFAPLSSLLDLSARFSTSGTLWLLPKGRSAAQELTELRGWSHMFHVEQSLTDPDAGIVIGTLTGRKGPTP